MSILVLDVENTTTLLDKDHMDYSPFEPGNQLVSVGFSEIEDGKIGPVYYGFFTHSDPSVDFDCARQTFHCTQAALDRASLLVGHNLKHDLLWLLESGFSYSGPCYDTMIGEYVWVRGRKDFGLDLAECAERRGCAPKKKDLTQDYLKRGVTFFDIPKEIVEEYGRADVQATAELYLAQLDLYRQAENQGLVKTLDLMNAFLPVLADMERNGIAIDMEALEKVEAEYRAEKAELETKLQEIVGLVMGDTPVNLSSPDQLSMLVYSRRLNDKKQWAETFNIGSDDRGKKKRRPNMSATEFTRNVRQLTTVVKRTQAQQCPECEGRGTFYKVKKDGGFYKNPTKCPTCGGAGVIYVDTGKVAGLKLSPPGIDFVAAGGFVTNKHVLPILMAQAEAKGNLDAMVFLQAVTRLNAVDTYLSSFIGGIKRAVKQQDDGSWILHANFNQCMTATGRLSSNSPNFQNQPRGDTFPVRRAIVSRFVNGVIGEADYAQLEFRGAGQLSGDRQLIKDVEDGLDVHAYTASVLTAAGQETTRQQAKTRTFKPLTLAA